MNIEYSVFIKKFSEAVEQDSVVLLSPNTNFKELGFWDSFSLMVIIAMVDQEYNIIISSNEINAVDSLEDLFNFIKQKKNNV